MLEGTNSMIDVKKYRWENRTRSLAKAITWRILGTMVTFFATFSITNSLNIATTVGIIEFFLKILLFYVHERFWVMLDKFWINYKGKGYANIR